MKKLITICAVAGLILAVSGVAQAEPVTISVTGTAETTALGYTAGESYTFTWAVADNYTGGNYDQFRPDGVYEGVDGRNNWSTMDAADNDLFAAISGDGLTGNWSRPTSAGETPVSYIGVSENAYGDTGYSFSLGANESYYATDIGLSADGTALLGISASVWLADSAGFSYVSTGWDEVDGWGWAAPDSYFADHTGVYSALLSGDGAGDNKIELVYGWDSQTYTATSLVFEPTQVSVVPEPATIALLGLGGLMLRRRKRA